MPGGLMIDMTRYRGVASVPSRTDHAQGSIFMFDT